MIICFNGIDGSGKSMQARALVERLNRAGRPAVYLWCGGESWLTRPLTRLAQRMLGAPRLWAGRRPRAGDARSLDQDVGARYRGYLSTTRRLFAPRIVRTAWLRVALLEHAAEIWKLMLPHRAAGRILICDRYIYDSIVDVAVLAGLEPAAFLPLLRDPLTFCVPRPRAGFLLDLPAEAALRRKDDVADPAILEVRVPLYRAAAAGLGMRVLDATAPPATLADEIWLAVERLLSGADAAPLRIQRR